MLYTATGYVSPTRMTLLGARVGGTVAKAVCAAAITGRLTPQMLGEAIISSSSVRGHVQGEVLRLVAVRISLKSPERIAWLIHLVTEYMATQSSTSALATLGKRTALYHIASFGLRGTVASAVAAAAVQASIQTCQVVTTRVFCTRSRISMAQYKYNLMTTAANAAGTVVGGGLGAAVGTLACPGFGTALVSVLFSMGGGCLPSYLRDKQGPDDKRRAHMKEVASAKPLQIRDGPMGFLELYDAAVERQRLLDGDDSYIVLRGRASPVESVASLSSAEEDPEEEEEDRVLSACSSSRSGGGDAGGIQSTLHFRTSVSGDMMIPGSGGSSGEPLILRGEEDRAFSAKAVPLEATSWEEVDACVDAHGEDELTLIFSI